MRVLDNHWLARVGRRRSPNSDARPPGAVPELVVIHNISLPAGRFGTGAVEALFTNNLDTTEHPSFADLAGVHVSAHLFLDRQGRCLQFVPFDERAWHAGLSTWRQRTRCNDFSIGIELEGTDHRRYTAAQYRVLVRVLSALFARYPRLSSDAVVGHQEIAPGRKT